MVKTQIQLPDDLYRQVKRLSERKQWSLAETIRRGVEEALRMYPEETTSGTLWKMPCVSVGKPKLPPDRWREAANPLKMP